MLETLDFGGFIRALREGQGATQDVVSQRGGPSRQVIGELENGQEFGPSEATLRKLDAGLRLPSGLLRSVLICGQGPVSDRFDLARVRGVPPHSLGLHCDSGEELEWPGTLLVGGFDGLQDRLLHAGQSMLIDVDALPRGDAESGAGYHFIRRWTDVFSADAVRSTTLRAGIFNRGVVDALPAVATLQEARKLLEALQVREDVRWAVGDVQEAALAALFVAYVAFSADVSAFDVLDRIQLRGPALFPAASDQQAGAHQPVEPRSSSENGVSAEVLDGLISRLWGKFRTAVGLAADYGQRPDVKALYDYLGEALRQRREIVNVTLPSGPGGLPARSDITVWPLVDIVRTMPSLLLYDGRRFGSLPDLWEWCWEANNPRIHYWHVTSTAFVRSSRQHGAKLVRVGADIDELIIRRFAGLAVGEAVLSHRRAFDGGWLAVLTVAKSHGLESHPVFLPELGTAS
ncbi:MAG: helix-turn-helix domain-containing protein [Mycobacterium sp.]|nr:helix-turn-helix domain-containing protein [Mycobacterium sp.]